MTKILSWNVNGIRACSKKGLLDTLAHLNPDFVCVQETKAMKEQCEEIVEALSPFDGLWHSAEKPGYSGVLTLRKSKSGDSKKGCGISDYDREGRVIVSDLGAAYLINLYIPNGAQSEDRHFFKMKFLDDILKFFKKLDAKKPLILTGDFNIAHRAIDIHDPIRLDGESGFEPEERDWMDKFVGSGFIDTFRLKHGEKKDQYSWWSYRQLSRERNKGWRIDYFFVSDRIKDRVKSIEMHQNILGSDHCPLSLEIEI